MRVYNNDDYNDFHKEVYKNVTGEEYSKEGLSKWFKGKGYIKINGLGWVIEKRFNFAKQKGMIGGDVMGHSVTPLAIKFYSPGSVLRYLTGDVDKIEKQKEPEANNTEVINETFGGI